MRHAACGMRHAACGKHHGDDDEATIRYEDDLYAWSQEQAALLRTRRTEGLDWENLAEEILSMAVAIDGS